MAIARVISSLFFTGCLTAASVTAFAQGTPPAAPAPAALDLAGFRDKVQPLFLDKKPGFARCYVCHSQGTTFRLQRLPEGRTAYNEEETKMIKETRKVFADDAIRVTATCVRVPVLRAHSEALNFECERPISAAEVRTILADAPGVRW